MLTKHKEEGRKKIFNAIWLLLSFSFTNCPQFCCNQEKEATCEKKVHKGFATKFCFQRKSSNKGEEIKSSKKQRGKSIEFLQNKKTTFFNIIFEKTCSTSSKIDVLERKAYNLREKKGIKGEPTSKRYVASILYEVVEKHEPLILHRCSPQKSTAVLRKCVLVTIGVLGKIPAVGGKLN